MTLYNLVLFLVSLINSRINYALPYPKGYQTIDIKPIRIKTNNPFCMVLLQDAVQRYQVEAEKRSTGALNKLFELCCKILAFDSIASNDFHCRTNSHGKADFDMVVDNEKYHIEIKSSIEADLCSVIDGIDGIRKKLFTSKVIVLWYNPHTEKFNAYYGHELYNMLDSYQGKRGNNGFGAWVKVNQRSNGNNALAINSFWHTSKPKRDLWLTIENTIAHDALNVLVNRTMH